MNLLAFDIGGTQIKYGVVTSGGEVLSTSVVDTPKTRGGQGLLACLRDLVAKVAEPYIGIAISTFGLVDVESGCILGAAEAIEGYVGTSLKAELEREFGLPVSVDNDVNCVAVAEGWLGAAQGASNYIAIAVGTGIGGGVVIHDRIYRGHRAAAGEWGYMKVAGVVWEDHASMRGLLFRANLACHSSPARFANGREVFAAYDAQDAQVVSVVHAWIQLLATGIANLIYAFNPQRVVIGGGISGRGEIFLRQITEAIDHELQTDFKGMTEVVLANAGNHAGMIGAVKIWQQSHAPSNT